MLPVLGFFTVIAATLRTVLFDVRLWTTLFGITLFTWFKQNGLKLVSLGVVSVAIYKAQDIILGFFGQISPILQIILENIGVPAGITIIISGYIWRYLGLGKSIQVRGR